MTDKDIFRLRRMLLDRRSDVLDRVRSLEDGWGALAEREIELEEEAQKAGIYESYDRLDEHGKTEIEQIDLALSKMVSGEYGICESCGDDIVLKRLEAIPWTRLCVDCAREYEKGRKSLPETSEALASSKLPNDFQGMPNEQLKSLISERLQKEVRLETEEIEVSFLKGVVTLAGAVQSESEHRLVLQILTEEMGFGAISDRLRVSEEGWENDDRDLESEADSLAFDNRMVYDSEDTTEDVFEAAGEGPPTAPAEGRRPHTGQKSRSAW